MDRDPLQPNLRWKLLEVKQVRTHALYSGTLQALFPLWILPQAFFSPEKGGPRFLGHVQIQKSVFLLVFCVFYVLFNELSSFVPTLDIATGAFFPQQ